MKLLSSLLGAACLAGISTAQLLRYSPPGQAGLSYAFAAAQPNLTGVPDIYLQIQGPASKSWIALGQGSSMSGSQMFVIYANAAGTNVTLSTRLSSGHQEPSAEDGSNVVLLPGSGIANGNMTANIFCQKCSNWPNGGAMNLNGSGQPWIWASKSGDPIKSDSTTAHIQQHDDGAYAGFKLDLNSVVYDNSSGLNPFVNQANASTIDVGGSIYDGLAIPIHGIVMCLAFIVGFPFGAFLIRLASFRGLVWIHATVQILSYLGSILGLGLGVYIANKGAADITSFHPVFGIIIIVLLIFQPVLGYVHHLQYKRYHAVNPYTHAHVWFGRLLISAGLFDGLFGLILARHGAGTIVAYCIVAGGVWVLWVGVVIWAAKRQKKVKAQRNDIRMAALVNEQDGRTGDGGMYNGGVYDGA